MQTSVKIYNQKPIKMLRLPELEQEVEFRKRVCDVLAQSDDLTIPDMAKELNSTEDDVAQALYRLCSIPNSHVEAGESKFTNETRFYING